MSESIEQQIDRLNQIAVKLYRQSDYSQAVIFAKQALELTQRLRGDNHIDVATRFNNLAQIYKVQGHYSEAEPLLKRALALLSLLENEHRRVALSWNNLANLYREQGRYSEAEPLLKQALNLLQHQLGDEHQDVALIKNNLAELYRKQGRYGEAELFFKQALNLWQRLLGDEDFTVAVSLNNLAALYQDQGRYKEAESLLKQALNLLRHQLRDEHRCFVASSLNNLALLYKEQWRYDEAESLYKEALRLRQRIFGDEHPDVAQSLNNLATLYYDQERYSEAESLLKQALKLRLYLLGEEDPNVVESLNNLAALYYDQERYSEAELLLIQALNLLRCLWGNKHPNVAASLQNLATLLTTTDRPTEALKYRLQATQLQDRTISQVFATSCENDRLVYLQAIRWNFDLFLSLVYGALSDSAEAVQAALDVVLKRKALTATALATRNRALHSGRYPHLTSEFQQLCSLSDQIVYLTFSPLKPNQLINYQKKLAQMQARYDELERELVSQVPEIKLQQQLQTVDRNAVLRELPDGTTMVEFVLFVVFDFKAVRNRGEVRWQPERYLAFVLPAKQPDSVQMIDLGLAEDIDRLVQDFRDSVIPGKPKNTGDLLDFGDWDETLVLEIMKSNTAAGIKLREAIFDPIRPYLSEMKSLILAPDGALNLIPFQILPIDETGKQLLMDEYTISYLSVGRDILRSKVQPTRPASAPLVIADPDFDLTAEQCAESHSTNLSPPLDILNTLGGDRRFERMFGTRLLGESVAKRLKDVRLYLEAEAVESHLTTCQSPRILLIATHGIFFSEPQNKTPTQELTLSRVDLLSKGKIENPMMRSGLALAGANTWLADGSLPKEAGKGFIFAQDVAGLDLWANEITVLSACNTAMGDIKIGEGVFGLRRAFAIAGAKTLVMSLWSVPDKATALLMERFFENCDRGLGRAEALQEAQNYLRTITVKELRQSSLGLEVLKDLLGVKELDLQVSISCQEDDKPLEHPFYWGAWVCQGDTTPLPFPACS